MIEDGSDDQSDGGKYDYDIHPGRDMAPIGILLQPTLHEQPREWQCQKVGYQCNCQIFHKKHFPRDLQDKWSKFSYKSTPKVYDCHVIKAEYLIENIDLAFAAWQKRPWRHSLSFDEFCEWILPYRIGDEPLENWRKVF